MDIKYCSKCGAQITTEICPYCSNTSIINQNKTTEYQTINCKTLDISIGKILGYIILIVWTLPLAIWFTTFMLSQEFGELNMYLVYVIPLVVIGITSLVLLIFNLCKNNELNKNGVEIEGIIKEYKTETNSLTQIENLYVKILLEINEDKKYILLKLAKKNKKRYSYKTTRYIENHPIESKIKLKTYNDWYKIIKD